MSSSTPLASFRMDGVVYTAGTVNLIVVDPDQSRYQVTLSVNQMKYLHNRFGQILGEDT